MKRTYPKPGARAGLGIFTALLVLLAGTGSCVASGAAEPVRLATMAAAAPLDQGAGYDSTPEAGRVQVLQRVLTFENDGLNWPHCGGLNWPHLRPIVT